MSKKGLLFLLYFPMAGLAFCQSSQDYFTLADKAFDGRKSKMDFPDPELRLIF